MRSQKDRDAVTVDIFTSLLIFAFVLAVGAIPMLLVDRFLGDGTVVDVLGYLVLACAALAAFIYLRRHRRP